MRIKLHQKTLKRITLYFCVISFLFVALAGGYVFVVIEELKRKLANQSLFSEKEEKQISHLEVGSLTLFKELKSFSNFLEAGSLSLSEKFEDNTLELRGQKVLIKEHLELPPIFTNECRRYRCLQNRVPFSQIPSSLWKGLLGIEDFRFFQHEGIDYISILRAIVADIKAMSLVQGGSTLTQQLAKNLFLSNEKKLERKIREMIYAIYLEKNFTKDEILTMYFNEVFWGVVGGVYIKGVHMASLIYFDKAPRLLNDFEAAMLIGMLKGPYFYHPINHLERLKRRTNVVFNRLRELRLVSTDDSLVWNDEKWAAWQKALIEKNEGSELMSLYLTGENGQLGMEAYEKFIFYQSVAMTRKDLKERTEGADIAVKTAVLNSNCEDFNCSNKFTYYSKFERDKEKAILEEKHQVGSVLKPIIYQQLLEEGRSLEDKISTRPITLDLISGKWTPDDASYGELEEVTLKYAIQKSRNIPLIRVSQEVGFDALEERLIEYFPNMLTPLGEYPAQLLGAIELSLSQLSNAYLKFFHKQCELFNRGLASYEDSLLYYLAQAEETTISRVAEKVIKQSLIFGKTGTTNRGLDNWYIAFDGQNFYAIWFGVDSAREDKDLRLYGSNSSFKIFQNFIQYRGKQVSEFFCR